MRVSVVAKAMDIHIALRCVHLRLALFERPWNTARPLTSWLFFQEKHHTSKQHAEEMSRVFGARTKRIHVHFDVCRVDR